MAVRIDAGRQGLPAPSSGGVVVRSPNGASPLEQVGRSLSNFADGQLQQMRQERAEEEAAADRVAVAKAAAAARLDWQKQLTDEIDAYDGAEPGFAERLVGKYQEDARARLDGLPERIRKDVELDLVQFGERLTSAAIEGEAGKRQAWTMRGLSATLDDEAMRILERPDDLPGALASLARLSEGAPPALREKFEADGRRVLVATYAEAMLRDDPVGFLTELQDGILDDVLTTDSKARYLGQAQAGTDRLIKEANAAQEAERKRQEAAAKDLAARVVAFYNAGLAPPADLLAAAEDAAAAIADPGNLERMKLAEYRMRKGGGSAGARAITERLKVIERAYERGLQPDPDLLAAARAEIEASGSEQLAMKYNRILETAQLRQEAALMPMPELETRLTDLRTGKVDEAELAEIEVLEKVRAARVKRGATDNIGWAAANGVPITPINPASEGFVSSLLVRVNEAEVLAGMTGEVFQMFSSTERTQLGRHLEGLTPEKQADFLGTIAMAAGARSGSAIQEIAAKQPLFGQAGYLTATGRAETAELALRGAAVLKANKTLLPASKKALNEADNDVLRGVIPENRQDVRTAIVETARALYALEADKQGIDAADFDEKLYRRSLQQAAGQLGDTGGIAKVGKDQVWLPAHMTRDDMQRTLKSMSLEEWVGFSYSGGSAPSVIGSNGEMEALTLRELSRARLVTVGEGRYQIMLVDPALSDAAGYALDGSSPTDNPKPYVLDLTRVSPMAVSQRRSSEEALDRARRRTEANNKPNPIWEAQQSDAYKNWLEQDKARRAQPDKED